MFLHLYPTFICKIYNDHLLKQILPLSPITEERIATKYIHIQVNPIYDRLFQHKTLENSSLYHLLQKPETAEDSSLYHLLQKPETAENSSLYHLLQKPETADDYPKSRSLESVLFVFRSIIYTITCFNI